MSTFRIELSSPISDDLACDIAKHAVHAARGVKSLTWDRERRVATVELDPGISGELASSKVRTLVDRMTSRYRPLPKRVLRENRRRDKGELIRDVERELARRGFVRELGPGQVALSGPALAFSQALDARIANEAKRRMGARQEAYPALIPSDVLHRCGYLASFPHAATMVTHLSEDVDAIERFRLANRESPSFVVPEPDALAHPPAFLSPAVCYHHYPSLEGSRLAGPISVVTASGQCFRYESRNMRGLDRLWDFTMREVIFCGTEEAVVAARVNTIELGFDIGCDLDLDLRLESASDPFFSADYAQKTYWQTRGDLKFEMLLEIPSPGEARQCFTAAASFNLHESFFGKTFRFEAEDGQIAFTGCAAWGLSRWILAAFAQHGLDSERWPAAWRKDVFA